jgi:hypothetical protein
MIYLILVEFSFFVLSQVESINKSMEARFLEHKNGILLGFPVWETVVLGEQKVVFFFYDSQGSHGFEVSAVKQLVVSLILRNYYVRGF